MSRKRRQRRSSSKKIMTVTESVAHQRLTELKKEDKYVKKYLNMTAIEVHEDLMTTNAKINSIEWDIKRTRPHTQKMEKLKERLAKQKQIKTAKGKSLDKINAIIRNLPKEEQKKYKYGL